MIVFHRLRYRNFLATGNYFTEIEFDTHPTTLIVGVNGAGKTTLIEALCFALFNRSLRGANKPTLINSIIGKNLVVEVEFSVNGMPYLVKRGMRPNIFEIWRQGGLLDQGTGIAEYQNLLEKHILKMNFKSFTQIVILGSGNYIPFLQLPAQSRREVIEDLLDIQVFSTMNNILKDRIKANDTLMQELGFKLAINENSIKNYLDYQTKLAKMNASILGEKKERANQLKEEIKELEYSIHETQRTIDDNMERWKVLQKKSDGILELMNYTSEHEEKLKKLRKEVKFYNENNHCPTCHQTIDGEFKRNIIDEKTILASYIEEAIKEVESTYGPQLQGLQEDIRVIREDVNMRSDSILKKRALQKYLESELNNLKKELEELNQTQPHTNGELEQLEMEKKDLMALEEEMASQRELYNTALNLLKDGGIKSRIVRQYIPIINQLINKYLEDFDFFVSFHLDENFDEQIKSRGRDDFNYESFSEGEKVRINLAVLFAWMSIARMRNSVSCSLLIMDEILDGSLDTEGTDVFLRLLKPIIGDRNAFVISHKHDLQSKFDKVLEFHKTKNFSHMVEAA